MISKRDSSEERGSSSLLVYPPTFPLMKQTDAIWLIKGSATFADKLMFMMDGSTNENRTTLQLNIR